MLWVGTKHTFGMGVAAWGNRKWWQNKGLWDHTFKEAVKLNYSPAHQIIEGRIRDSKSFLAPTLPAANPLKFLHHSPWNKELVWLLENHWHCSELKQFWGWKGEQIFWAENWIVTIWIYTFISPNSFLFCIPVSLLLRGLESAKLFILPIDSYRLSINSTRGEPVSLNVEIPKQNVKYELISLS